MTVVWFSKVSEEEETEVHLPWVSGSTVANCPGEKRKRGLCKKRLAEQGNEASRNSARLFTRVVKRQEESTKSTKKGGR